MRTYTFLASRPGGFMNWPGRALWTEHRIGVVACFLFRRWFGRSPDRNVWIWKGNMALCRDRRGNCIEVTQHNWEGRMLPVHVSLCPCGRSPLVGLALCADCHRQTFQGAA